MFAFIFIVIATISLFFAVRYFNLARHLQHIPRSKIRSASQGYIEIVGQARPLVPVPLHAPETDIPCVWLELTYRHVQGDSSTTEFKRTESSFLVDDGTGLCRIDPHTMAIETRAGKNNELQKLGLGGSSGLLSARWIAVGETVHAYGKFDTLANDFHQQKKDLIKQRLNALKQDQALMQRFDRDRDGRVDIDEWERAREFVRQDVEDHFRDRQRAQDSEDEIHVLRPPDDDRLPFLVSSFEEIRTIRRYQLYALGFLLLFLVSGAALVDAWFLDWLDYEFARSLQ